MAPQKALATACVLFVLLGVSDVTALSLSKSGPRPPGQAVPVNYNASRLAGKMRAFVIVRTYRKQIDLIERLVSSLLDGSHSQVDTTFVLLPTESKDVAVFKDLATNLSSSGLDVHVPWFLRYPSAYTDARKDVTKCGCPPVRRTVQLADKPWCYKCNVGNHVVNPSCSDMYTQMCVYENEAHYRLTDWSIEHVMKLSKKSPGYSKTSLLVTNGDNVYRKAFLAQMMAVPEAIAISDFAERPQNFDWQECWPSEVRDAHVDLGAFMVDIDVLRQHNVTFSNSIPSFEDDVGQAKRMWAFHDSDFWFINNLVNNEGIPYQIIHECMFAHVRLKKPILHMDKDRMVGFIS